MPVSAALVMVPMINVDGADGAIQQFAGGWHNFTNRALSQTEDELPERFVHTVASGQDHPDQGVHAGAWAKGRVKEKLFAQAG